MNFFELHIGDLEQATAHLTGCEDGIYNRMLRRYYATEKPLPADVASVQRVVRARSREEKKAVTDMLAEYFILQDNGWHNSRCDREIAQYLEREPERAIRKANEVNRIRQHREERSGLFKKITDAGGHAPWNIGIQDLRDLARKLAASALPDSSPPTTAPVTLLPEGNTPAPEKPEKTNGKARKRSMPHEFAISDRVKQWATENGFDRIDEHLQHFRLQCEAKGYEYANWDAALMKAIATDWAQIRKGTMGARDYTAMIAKLEAADDLH